MGLFDKLKKSIGDITQSKGNAAPPPPPPEDDVDEAAHEDTEPGPGALDVAGFDVDDEDGFFEAVLHMESEGRFGGTDESRAAIMQRYGIRDHAHWQTVKESVYALLAGRHGSYEEVAQRESNWRMGQMQRQMQQNVVAKAASGEMAPVEGVTLEQWAALNAALAQGAHPDDLLKGAAIDRARWDRVSGEWTARMARDTTFAIATTYGEAFQKASTGKYADYAREANAARAANRDLAMEPPVSYERYLEMLYEQSYAVKEGRDAAETLRSLGLSIVDWTDLGCFMGYYFQRNATRRHAEFNATYEKVAAAYEAKHPGVKVDLDIKF